MAINLGVAYVDIVPSTKGLAGNLRGQIGAPLADAGDQAGRDFGDRFRGAVQGAVKVASTATAAALTAAAGVGAAALTSGWSRLTTIQDSTAALTISLGSSVEAASLLGDVLDTVRGTPFNLDQFARGGQQLVGMGVEAQKVPGYLTAIGEASATQGGRANEFAERLTTVFGQVAASGQVGLDAVWQISATGVNALGILANSFDVTRDEMKDMISEGAVPAGAALDTLAAGIVNGTDGPAGATRALAGTMEALRLTMSGAVSGIRPALARLGEAVLKPFSPAIVAGANGLVTAIDLLGKRAGTWATSLASSRGVEVFIEMVSTADDSVGGLLDRLGDISGVAAAATAGLGAFGSGSLPVIGQFLPAINPVVAAITALVLATPEARSALAGVLADVGPLIVELGAHLMPILVDLQTIVGDVLPPALDLAGAGLGAVLMVAVPLADAIASVTGFIADHSQVVVAAAAGWVAFKAAMMAGTAWTAMSAGITTATAALSAMRAAIAGIAATRGVSEMAATLGVLRATLTAPVSGGTAAGGAIAGFATGAGLAMQTLATNTDQAREANTEFLTSLDTDMGSTDSLQQRLNAINSEILWLQETANQSNWAALGQNLNPFDDNSIDRSREQISLYEQEITKLTGSLMMSYTAAGKLGIETAEVDRWVAALDLDPATMSQSEFTAAIRDGKAAVAASTPVVDGLAAAQEVLSDETATATDRLKAWKQVLDQTLGVNLGVFEATTSWQGSLVDLTGTMRENGSTIDAATEAGRANRDALASTARSAIDLALAYGETDAGAEGAARSIATSRDRLIEAGQRAGITKKAMEDYVNQLGLTPEVVETLIKANGIDTVETAIAHLTRPRTVTVDMMRGRGFNSDYSSVGGLDFTNRRWGGIDHYGLGGIRQAMVGSGRDIIWWDEPATGGEAYVPRNGDPIRSKKVLAEAASWYGLGLIDPSAGGTAGDGGDGIAVAVAPGGDVHLHGPVGDDWSAWLARTWRQAQATGVLG